VSEVQTVSISATGGTFQLAFDTSTTSLCALCTVQAAVSTSAITFPATAATVDTQLELLSNIPTNGVTVALETLAEYAITSQTLAATAGDAITQDDSYWHSGRCRWHRGDV
jgi:hypothetical protein